MDYCTCSYYHTKYDVDIFMSMYITVYGYTTSSLRDRICNSQGHLRWAQTIWVQILPLHL